MMATQTQSQPRASSAARAPTSTGEGWLVYAGVLVLVGAVLNIVWGIAAIGNAHFFIANAQYVISDLNTWGWITLIVGVVQLFAAFSVWSGGAFGRWTGAASAAVGCLTSLLSIPAYPFWSLAVFSVSVLVVYGLVAYGGRHPETTATRRTPPAAA
jgi:hypothetical protein